VSGYWPVGNKYPSGSYNRWLNSSLKINAPYVLHFGLAEDRDWLLSAREGLPTEWHHTPIAQMEREFEQLTGSRGAASKERRFAKSWGLHVIWFMKLLLLQKASETNPFNTPYFAWVDAGIVRYRRHPPPPAVWPNADKLARVPQGVFVYSPVSARWHCFAGTAFLVDAPTVRPLATAYYGAYHSLCTQKSNDTTQCINRGNSIDRYYKADPKRDRPSACQTACADDQTLFSYVRDKLPDRFYSINNLIERNVAPAPTQPGKCVQPRAWSGVVDHLY